MDESNNETGGESGEQDGWPARKVVQLSTHRFEAQSLYLWRCCQCDGYFTGVRPLSALGNSIDDVLGHFTDAIDSTLPAESKTNRDQTSIDEIEVVVGLAIRPYNEIDRAADRLVNEIPCACEFHES